MAKAKAESPPTRAPEPEVQNHRAFAAAALQHFANSVGHKPHTLRESAANFFVGLVQLSEQEGFIIEDALRTARIRIFNAKK